ncbi:hypothetical protein [Streptomyces sp. NBC_00859]|uniref:hypothetical protein n=1 Tax=Streptomyces sp. NBC_00859 TaxID=2903682 RepID=UPI00387000ED|nr:hypothetical protein OG584_21145 [Streptomyces sp. NBC_00859]
MLHFIDRLTGPVVRFLNRSARRRPGPPSPPLVLRRRRLLVCRVYLPLGHQLRPNLGAFSALAHERLEYSRIAWFDLHGVGIGPRCPLHGVAVR